MSNTEDNAGITVNKEKGRFELDIKGGTSFVDFKESNGVVSLMHVEVPFTLRNHGVGSGLMNSVMEHLKGEDKKVKPVCSFAVSYLKSNPQWHDRVDSHQSIH